MTTFKLSIFIIWTSFIIISVHSINVVVSFGYIFLGSTFNCLCLHLLFLLVFFKFSLHVWNSICVELAFDCGCGFNDIEVSQEVVKWYHAFLKVINADWTIIIEIEPHPSSRNIDVTYCISLCNISLHFLLLGCDHVDVRCDGLSGSVVQKENMLDQRSEFVINKCEKILSIICNHSKFVFKFELWIDRLIKWDAPNFIGSLSTIVNTNI